MVNFVILSTVLLTLQSSPSLATYDIIYTGHKQLVDEIESVMISSKLTRQKAHMTYVRTYVLDTETAYLATSLATYDIYTEHKQLANEIEFVMIDFVKIDQAKISYGICPYLRTRNL